MSLLLLYRPRRSRLSGGTDPGEWYELEIRERSKPRKKKLKLTKKFLPLLKERELPQTPLGAERWVDSFVKEYKSLLVGPLIIPQVSSSISKEGVEALATSWAKSVERKRGLAFELLIDFFIVQQSLIEARKLATYAEEEDAVLLFLFSR